VEAPGADIAAIVSSDMTISSKIRALDAAGHARADIARLLGKRYQHVRNVLEDARSSVTGTPGSERSEPFQGMEEAPRDFERSVEARGGGYYRFVLGRDGSLVVPAEVVQALGIRNSRVVMGRLKDDAFTLIGPDAAMREIQAIARKYIQPGVSLVDELIAERRAEATREDAEG
jgi:hypothetical protein